MLMNWYDIKGYFSFSKNLWHKKLKNIVSSKFYQKLFSINALKFTSSLLLFKQAALSPPFWLEAEFLNYKRISMKIRTIHAVWHL